ncbi:glycosyl transferase family 21-domain-containing protein, partial [Powellomyces hirtus]
VTIIRPLKGVDCNMVENLSSSFLQQYPNFELIFAVADPKDPACDTVQELIEKFPHVDAKLFTGCEETGVNPKINNMLRGYNAAKHDIIWILDSNVYVNPGCMSRSVAALTLPGIGLVHHLPCGVRPLTNGSCIEQMFLNTAHAKMYVTINKLSVASCLIGKSNLFRRSDLADLGGLENYGKYLSEDNIIGEAIWAKGLRHRMTTDLAYQTLGSLSVLDYFHRRARWIRIRKYTVTAATLTEPFTESVVNGLLGALGFWKLMDIPILPFLAVHFATWITSDWLIATTLDKATRNKPASFFAGWIIREVFALPLWLFAMAGSTVEWRGRLFWLHTDGTVEP